MHIAKRMGRSPSTISRLVIKKRPLKKQGRKPLLSKGKVDKLVAKAEAMIHKADRERVLAEVGEQPLNCSQVRGGIDWT